MASMSDVCIRFTQPSDRDELLRFRESLWPDSSAEEHARELTLILENKDPVTMPLVILVAEASDSTLAGFLEVDLRSHADGCNPLRPVSYVEGWYVAENYRRQGVGGKLLARKTGHVAGGALRSRPIPGSTMNCTNAYMRRLATKWWTAACITVRRCDIWSEGRRAGLSQPCCP
jgi:hypothetical protein